MGGAGWVGVGKEWEGLRGYREECVWEVGGNGVCGGGRMVLWGGEGVGGGYGRKHIMSS